MSLSLNEKEGSKCVLADSHSEISGIGPTILSVDIQHLMPSPPGGGGALELFFDEVCGPRSETLTHF